MPQVESKREAISSATLKDKGNTFLGIYNHIVTPPRHTLTGLKISHSFFIGIRSTPYVIAQNMGAKVQVSLLVIAF